MAKSFKIHSGLIIALLCFCINGAETKCSGNTFGPNCDFECHCLNNEQCNSITGNCSSGCDFDWVGPACQHENKVPVGQTNENVMVTRHQSNIQRSQFAILAVDRNLSTCSQTNYANMSTDVPWWKLWLAKEYKVRNISIVTQKDSLGYFKNFEVMVENNTFESRYGNGYTSQEVCYKHDNSSPTKMNFDVTCNKTIYGNQIRIRLATNGTQLVLCDVRIYGECSDGTFGVSCADKCSTHCTDVCNKDYGTCSSCSAGWIGTSCNQVCGDGKYGENCRFICSGNCKDNVTCNNTDGVCTDGCSPGYKGNSCRQKCSVGEYGENCANNCSRFCLTDKQCRQTDGVCVDGCKPGYRGRKCEYMCMSGYYGMECNTSCSTHCIQTESRNCSHVDGSCLHGCGAGWKGTRCEEKCDDGLYGRNCSFECSGNCKNNLVCNNVNGSCDQGCMSGYKGVICNETCTDGEYGEDCANNCSAFCTNGTACRKTDGICVDGCKPGYRGGKCDLECQDGFYGANCSHNCSKHCLNDTVCTHTNGTCTDGCDPGWTGETCKEDFGREPEKHVGANSITEDVVVFIVLGVAGAVLLLVVVIVTYWKRKAINGKFQALFKRNKNSNENVFHNDIYIDEHPGTENITNVDTDQGIAAQKTDPVYTNTSSPDCQLQSIQASDHSCKTYNDTNAFVASSDTDYYNFMPAKRTPYAISVSELENVLKKKCLIEGYFKSQFETIPSGLLHPTTVANKPENRHKNRYKNMYPYDHCRVKLKELTGQPDSDYINASFIKGQGKDKAYIASQGPVKENVIDFWRMIWEMDVRMVVMVTNLSEIGKMKCIKYWGVEDEVVPYGDINVTTQAENVYAEFTTRDFKLFHQGDVHTTRNVTQLQFTAWPDKDVPNTSSSLLQFWRKVRQNDENKGNVWLVHCSAGVGRTGTFLAMDLLFDQGEKMGFIDVYNCVKDLRDQRVNLVQTHGQYLYLHKLMVEMFSLPSKPVNVDEFMATYHQLQKKDKKSGKMKLLVEYKSMESGITWPTTLKDQQAADEREADLQLSADAFRPILSNYVPGSSNTIKSTYIPSYYDFYEFIIAQWRPQFKMEACRLVFEKKIETVVTFPADQQHDEIFFEESVSGGDPFVVVCQSQIQKEHYVVKEHVLQTGKEKHYFKEIIFKCWSSENLVPEDPHAFSSLLTEVDTQRDYLSEYARKSILLQCWNGVDRSGLVAVLLNVLDRAFVDRKVSIPQIIRQLRYNKKELISSFEQYKFCYDVLYCRQESNATYANV